jgi:hypothetical protein
LFLEDQKKIILFWERLEVSLSPEQKTKIK